MLGGLLRVDERGASLWAAGGLLEHDWSGSAPAWARPLACRAAAASRDLGAIAVWTPAGVQILRGGLLPPEGEPWPAQGPLAVSPAGDLVAFVARGELQLRALDGDGDGAAVTWSLPGSAQALGFSPDGATLACAGGSAERGPGFLLLLAARGPRRGEVLARVNTSAPRSLLAWSPDGALLVAAGGRAIGLWTHDGLPAGELDEQPGDASSLAVSPAGDRVAVGYRGGPVALWNMPRFAGRGAYAGAVEGHQRTVRSLRFLAGGAGLASLDEQTVALWSLPSAAARRRLSLGMSPIEALVASPDRRRLLLAHGDGSLSVVSASSGERERALGSHAPAAFGAAWSPAGNLLASGGADGRVRLWGARRGDLRAEGQASGQVQGLAFADGGNALLVADDGGVGCWPLPLGALLPALAGLALRAPRPPPIRRLHTSGSPSGPCHAVAARGSVAAAAGADGRVHLGDAGGFGREAVAHAGHAWSLAFSPVDPVLACGGDEGAVALLDTRFGERLLRLSVPGGRVWSLAFSPDGLVLAVAGGDGAVRLLDVATGRVAATLAGHGDEVTAVLWSDAGELWSASRDGSLLRWSAARQP